MELQEFIGDSTAMTPEGSTLERWLEWGSKKTTVCATSVAEFAALLTPGRHANSSTEVIRVLLPEGVTKSTDKTTPAELIYALGSLMKLLHSSSPHALQLAASGYALALDRLRVSDPGGARRLQLALSMADHPSAWNLKPPGCDTPVPELQDGLLSQSVSKSLEMGVLGGGALPRWHAEAANWRNLTRFPLARPMSVPWMKPSSNLSMTSSKCTCQRALLRSTRSTHRSANGLPAPSRPGGGRDVWHKKTPAYPRPHGNRKDPGVSPARHDLGAGQWHARGTRNLHASAPRAGHGPGSSAGLGRSGTGGGPRILLGQPAQGTQQLHVLARSGTTGTRA